VVYKTAATKAATTVAPFDLRFITTRPDNPSNRKNYSWPTCDLISNFRNEPFPANIFALGDFLDRIGKLEALQELIRRVFTFD
jgi:hypothetical protein